jgi:cell shape-determining protein MreC
MEHLSEIISFIVGLIGGWAIKVTIDKGSQNKVKQSKIKAKGDVVGRDKHG